MSRFSIILPAAGRSSRFRDAHYKKPFAQLAGKAVWLYSAERFLNRPDCQQVILAIDPAEREQFQQRFGANVAILGIDVVSGGAERAETVERALAKVRSDADYVAVHDAARPCLANEWIDTLFAAAQKHQAAILALPITATLKRVGPGDAITETVDRRGLWEAQTPQVFARQLLLDAYAQRGDGPATDDAMLVERLGHPVHVVTGSPLNVKITTKADLRFAELALKALPKPKLDSALNPFAGDDMWK